MHKYLKDYYLANLINYMTDYSPDFHFAGFVPAPDEYFGVEIDKCNMVAVHLSKIPIKRCIADDKVKEQRYLDGGYNWVAMLYGNDNTSCIKRFKREEWMHRWFDKLTELHRDESWIFYNS